MPGDRQERNRALRRRRWPRALYFERTYTLRVFLQISPVHASLNSRKKALGWSRPGVCSPCDQMHREGRCVGAVFVENRRTIFCSFPNVVWFSNFPENTLLVAMVATQSGLLPRTLNRATAQYYGDFDKLCIDKNWIVNIPFARDIVRILQKRAARTAQGQRAEAGEGMAPQASYHSAFQGAVGWLPTRPLVATPRISTPKPCSSRRTTRYGYVV